MLSFKILHERFLFHILWINRILWNSNQSVFENISYRKVHFFTGSYSTTPLWMVSAQRARKVTFKNLIVWYDIPGNDLKQMLWKTVEGRHRRREKNPLSSFQGRYLCCVMFFMTWNELELTKILQITIYDLCVILIVVYNVCSVNYI